jgi:hypothetical protein
MVGKLNVYAVSVGRTEGTRSPGREGLEEMELKEIGYEGMDWIHLA